MIELQREGHVFVLTMDDGENRWNTSFVRAFAAALDEVEASAGPAALVTTSNSEKFFSNGLDLEWVSSTGEHRGGDRSVFGDEFMSLMGRIITLPIPTVAAVNGHAFGAGAMLAVAHDFRVMRADRGFLCFPEVDIRIPFTPGMSSLILAKTTPQTAVAAMTTGRRYGGADALASGLVDAVADEASLLDAAIAAVKPLVGKDAATLGTIKQTMYADTAAALSNP